MLSQTSFGLESKWNFHLPAGEIRWTLSVGKFDFLHTIDLTSNKRWAQRSESALDIFCPHAKQRNIIQAYYILLLYIPAKYSCYTLHTHDMESYRTWCYIVQVQLSQCSWSQLSKNVQISVSANADSAKTKWDRVQQNKLTWPVKNWKWQTIFQRFGDAAKRQLEAKWDMEVDKEGTIDVVDRYLQV